MELETERVRLRELVTDDAPFILALLNDPDFHRHIGDRGIRDLAAASDYIEQGPRQSYRSHGLGLLLVERKEDRAAMGICGLIRRPQLTDVDVGYAFLPAFRRQGYALEAVRAVLDDGYHRLGLERIVAIVAPDNQSSLQLLARVGMQPVSHIMMGEQNCLLLAQLDTAITALPRQE